MVPTINRASALATGPMSFPLGSVISDAKRSPFLFSEADLLHHMCVLGATGSGKSKFMELLMRYLIIHGSGGYALIDPHGDLSEDILAFLRFQMVVRGRKDLIKKFHYLEPSYEQVFHYDPFRFRSMTGMPEHLRPNAIRAWLHTKADRIGEIVQRKQGDTSFEGMARLQRVLTNVLIAVGTPVDKHGRHLPLADALVLLNREHERYEEVYRRVRPHLDPDVRALFDRFHTTKSQQVYLGETESSTNRLHSLLSPIVKAIFAEQTDTIDFESIIQNGEILLVNLRQTDMFSADQASAIGGLFIHELLSTAQNTERRQRKMFHLIVDEAGDFIGGDIQHALGVMRKFKMSVTLGAQDLSSFKKGKLDLRPKVLSQCGTKITFRQEWPEDGEILARVMGMGNLDFQKHYQVVDRPDGYEFLSIDEYSENFKWDNNWSNGFSTTESDGRTRTATLLESGQQSWSRSQSDSFSDSNSTSDGRSNSQTWNSGRSDTHVDYTPHSTSRTAGEGSALALQQTQSEGNTSTQSTSLVNGGGSGWSNGISDARAVSSAIGRSTSEGGSNGYGISIAHRKMPLAKHYEEIRESPQLLNSIADQLSGMQATIACLNRAQCVVKILGQSKSIVAEIAHVPEHWIGDDKFEEIEKAKRLITAQHKYCGVPQIGPEAQTKRLDEYVLDRIVVEAKPEAQPSPFDE